MALAGKIDGESYRVYVLLGDGECDEGLVWEAAMFAAHNKLDNVVAIIDRNGLQIDGPTEKVMGLEPLAAKWRAFGWHVVEADGHDFRSILDALDETKKVKGQPTAIIAYLTKGKGVSFMEWIADFHGKSLTREQLHKALEEFDRQDEEANSYASFNS
jgi:transketolase